VPSIVEESTESSVLILELGRRGATEVSRGGAWREGIGRGKAHKNLGVRGREGGITAPDCLILYNRGPFIGERSWRGKEDPKD